MTDHKDYNPKPVDTTDIEVPEALLPLVERLAENVHETWAAQRMKEGWRWGASRDDSAKTHPCLVPYAELPESEKEYDRKTAMQTLKLIQALGFKITR